MIKEKKKEGLNKLKESGIRKRYKNGEDRDAEKEEGEGWGTQRNAPCMSQVSSLTFGPTGVLLVFTLFSNFY